MNKHVRMHSLTLTCSHTYTHNVLVMIYFVVRLQAQIYFGLNCEQYVNRYNDYACVYTVCHFETIFILF